MTPSTIVSKASTPAPPVMRAIWVCALYIGIPLVAAYVVFLRRDVTGE